MSTILVVDDNREMHQLYRTVLQRPGHRLLAATSGGAAIMVMEMHFPDLIILDLAMPDMDGLAFLRLVRAQPEWRNIPILVITAFSTGQDLEIARALGATGNLVKADFSVKQLRSKIEECLGDSLRVNAA